MNKKILFYIIPAAILVTGFLIMQLLAGMREDPVRRTPSVVAKNVSAIVVEMGETQTIVEGLGRLASSQPVQLVSEAAGTMHRGEVPFMPGQHFRNGQVLLRIDDRQQVYNLNSTKSDFLNALATVLPEVKVDFPNTYEVWQSYFDRCTFDRPLEPLPETNERKIKLLLTRFNVYKLFFAVKNLEVALEKHVIRAPFNGAIVSTSLREESSARIGSVLGEIINLDNLELQVPVPASEIAWIDRSKPVKLSAEGFPGSWTGAIARIGSNVEQRTQTVPVFITVHGDIDRLYEGLYIRAEIPGRAVASGAIVPRRAVYEERFVYIVEDGTLQRRDITIGRRNPETVIVTAGLSNGDTLVTELLQGVSDGMPAAALLHRTKETAKRGSGSVE